MDVTSFFHEYSYFLHNFSQFTQTPTTSMYPVTIFLLIHLVIDITLINASFLISNSINSNVRCAYSTTEGDDGDDDNHRHRNLRMNTMMPCSDTIFWSLSDSSSSSSSSSSLETVEKTKFEMMSYLYKNLMSFDYINAHSLGFPQNMTQIITMNNNDRLYKLPDGLSNGIIEPTINVSIHAKQYYPWTYNVPKEIYFEYVVNFANVNEARTNWRPLFHELVQPIIKPILVKNSTVGDRTKVKEVISLLNDKIWTVAASYSNTDSIAFQHGQTPLIYDPMSVLLFGYASCTGLSIFFVDMLRTVGIPARLAGTAAWNGKEENGNHSWVEFFDSDDGKWYIMETKPASGQHNGVDLYDPCQWWFCNEAKVKDTLFWAARLDKCKGVSFPMAWDMDNNAVSGEDRTFYMRELCSGC